VSDAVVADRRATAQEVRAQAAAIRRLAGEFGRGAPRVHDDSTVVVWSSEPGYRAANRLSAVASEVVGAYVHVITDDVPGAASARPL
jgi:hypothetical protein